MPDGFKGLVIWVTSPPTVKPQASLTNLKYFFTSLALGLPKQLWSGYFIAVVLFDKRSWDSWDKDAFSSELIYVWEALEQLRTDNTLFLLLDSSNKDISQAIKPL